MRLGLIVRGSLGLLLAGTASVATAAPPQPISLQDSFRLGDDKGVLCRVQAQASGAALTGMFDRGYTIVCRDAATAVGRLYALRGNPNDTVKRLDRARGDYAKACRPAVATSLDGVRDLAMRECQLAGGDVGYRIYTAQIGRTTYVAEGLAGYDSALKLGLRTLIADRALPGTIEAATTSVADPAAFARVQAGALDPDQALAEGYRRNNSGSYAEAAEFFDTLLSRADGGESSQAGEYIANRALQRSNLGDFAEADALFAQVGRISTGDPVQLRLRRNYMALHLLNQRKLGEALAILDRPVAALSLNGGRINPGLPEIDRTAAAELNNRTSSADLGLEGGPALTPEERATILDGQARQLRGTVLRLQNRLDQAETALAGAEQDLLAVREGRVSSIARLRSQITSERAAIREARGDRAAADTLNRQALAQIEAEYPRSAAANGQRARLAAFLARSGQTDAALAAYTQVVQGAIQTGGSTTGIQNLLAPYFALLVQQIQAGRTALVTDFFAAAETLVRPGVADTQAVLARELSGGSDEAARLFRQSVNLTREVERQRTELARLVSLPQPTMEESTRLTAMRPQLAQAESDQATTQARLASYPRYRALSTTALSLADLQGALKSDEAYWKMVVVGPDIYAIYATQKDATAWRTGFSTTAELDTLVDTVRDSIVREENGQVLTFPFDLAAARQLFLKLAGPRAEQLAETRNLVFEPDGAMLRLPINLLVTDDASVTSYRTRQTRPNADEFDFTKVAWLGRGADISTAVSARAFRDTRRIAPSAAKRDYLGFGQNKPVSDAVEVASTRSMSGAGAIDCNWPLSQWNRPISAKELTTAQGIVEKDRRGGPEDAEVVTQGAFTDTAIMARRDLDQYRILHFATHGLVTAPRPECPARPALLTSFGATQSDGLLSFREIYDLKLDADLVILSACDTAGKATVAATREAGVTSGGGSALDGLVRSFIGAGGRSVVASHWPAPDDFNATGRLISGLFDAAPGTPVAEALRQGQLSLMAAPETSHPYYWSGFAIVGDGSQPVLRTR